MHSALLIITESWKQLKCPPTDKWIKMWHTQTHTHTHTHQNKILPFVAMQMDLEDLIFSEICQTEENNTVR